MKLETWKSVEIFAPFIPLFLSLFISFLFFPTSMGYCLIIGVFLMMIFMLSLEYKVNEVTSRQKKVKKHALETLERLINAKMEIDRAIEEMQATDYIVKETEEDV